MGWGCNLMQTRLVDKVCLSDINIGYYSCISQLQLQLEDSLMRNDDVGLLEAIGRQILQCKKDVLRLKLHLYGWKYDPDQPRVPGGESDAGQWTSDGNESSDKPEWRSAMASKRSDAFCNRQYEIDLMRCKAAAVQGCYSQAMERLQACRNGRQIPLLVF